MSEINETCPACAVRRKPYERGAWKGEQFWHKTCYAKAHGDEPYPCTCTRAESAEKKLEAYKKREEQLENLHKETEQRFEAEREGREREIERLGGLIREADNFPHKYGTAKKISKEARAILDGEGE